MIFANPKQIILTTNLSSILVAYCKEADQRISQKISEIKNQKSTIDQQIYQIADDVFAKGAYVPEHPLKV